jgi:cation diffusion facilitator CzcD-associated flavoprotein CzcO
MNTINIDKTALRKKYREERDKRLRSEGNDQYLQVKGHLAHYLEDPYLPVIPRAAKKDHVSFAFIGGGFGGLSTGARLVEAGISDVRIIEKGGDFGGAWYWNRYPGAQCDTASLIYMPLLEETGYMPSEKYAHAPEILAHCQRIGRHFKLYDHALFHTEVTELRWDEGGSHWHVLTNRGDDFTAQYIGIATGPLHVPKLPGIVGIESFKGHSFHTSRWDYDYTGGNPVGALMNKLADKRVAIIGTGATSVQCVPHLAKTCKALYVFQRTPSSVDARNNAPIDPEWFSQIATPGWQLRWLENFTANQAGGNAEVDLVQDGWTDLARRIRNEVLKLPREERSVANMLAAYEDADFQKMEEIRARVDDIVQDKEVAARLKAWYRQLCKRPCFHDTFLQSFNQSNVQLIDTQGQGVEHIAATGIVAAGKEYPVDCIIYASGFEVGTPYKRRAGFDLVGRNGRRLSEHWEQGMRSKHGMHVHGFPNAFFVQPTQGANLISNVPHNLSDAARTIALMVKHAQVWGKREIEVTQEAEEAWVQLMLTSAGRMTSSPDCTPGYYNNEGQDPGPAAKLAVGYPAGASAYFKYIEEWRRPGKYEGVSFR